MSRKTTQQKKVKRQTGTNRYLLTLPSAVVRSRYDSHGVRTEDGKVCSRPINPEKLERWLNL